MNSSDHHLDLITSDRSSPPHQTFFSTSSTHKRLPSPTSSRSRSPQRYFRLRDRFIRSYDQIELADQYQRAHELLSDFEDILLQINGHFLVKEETFRSETPICVHVEDLPIEFTYTRILTTTTRRKIEPLLDNLNNDPVVVDFKRQLEDLEQAAERFRTLDDLLPRTVYPKADAHRDQVQRLDEFQTVLKSTMDLDDQFSDDTKKTTNFIQAEDIKHPMLDINLQLDHLQSLTYSLELVDQREINISIYRRKLNRFIPIHDHL
ncbi:unnamed protein product [Rotaria sordida]|uniref:Uncharacterized protein n=1 Tax=Rotaria sordida TaxID=392033 RepID=A0A816ALE9_9BILA|nr:unnamed protein product [Rotaria sordida]CAF1597100.1 unnamed protein product [Rotaria sordida]